MLFNSVYKSIQMTTKKLTIKLKMKLFHVPLRCLGSMNLAAAELSMSYRSVWCRIRESEDRIGRKLLVSKGKGSALTPFARELMRKFTDLNAALKEDADEMFGNLL